MEILRLPAFNDNYIFLLYDATLGIAAVVDPGDAEPVLAALKAKNLTLTAILNTHHHSDHVGGNRQLLAKFPDAVVYGSQGDRDRNRIPGQMVNLQAGDRVNFAGRTAEILSVPAHTLGHIAYYFPPVNPDDWGELFCGDSLFSLSCGRLFEGTPEQLLAVMQQYGQLPECTRVWCAHEYTLTNCKFALSVDKNNPDLQQYCRTVQEQRNHNQSTIPSSIGLEKQLNPFLRWGDRRVQEALNLQEPVAIMRELRQRRERF
jgi:hydroxyacylglutathione hydrolase